jgi:hypothetical protein
VADHQAGFGVWADEWKYGLMNVELMDGSKTLFKGLLSAAQK